MCEQGVDEGERGGSEEGWSQVLEEEVSISVARFFVFSKGDVLV